MLSFQGADPSQQGWPGCDVFHSCLAGPHGHVPSVRFKLDIAGVDSV